VERLLARVLVSSARLRLWWLDPGDTPISRLPSRPEDVVQVMLESDAHQEVERFGYRLFPPAHDEELLEVVSSDAGAARWVQDYLRYRAFPGIFGQPRSLTDWMRAMGQRLLSDDQAIEEIWFDPSNSSPIERDSTLHTLSRRRSGLAKLVDGTYRVDPRAASVWPIESDANAVPYTVPPDQVIWIDRPSYLGPRTPAARALPYFLQVRVALQHISGRSYAMAHPEDNSLRAQAAWTRQSQWEAGSRLARSRMTQALCGSLLENQPWSSLYAPVTEYYLAWQHRSAVRVAIRLRSDLLRLAGETFFRTLLARAGYANAEVALLPIAAPSLSVLDHAFDEYANGKIDLSEYRLETTWMTESARRIRGLTVDESTSGSLA